MRDFVDYIDRPAEAKAVAKGLRAEIARLDAICKISELRKYLDWSMFAPKIIAMLATKLDEPFIRVMLSLAKRGYRYSAISMFNLWRRLKAIGQDHIITYFAFPGFGDPRFITPADLVNQCDYTHSMFGTLKDQLADNKLVEMSLRSLLGISQVVDIKTAFREWAKMNHPDKGGDTEKFARVMAAYDEWLDIQLNKEIPNEI